jgi:hypothetical protein
MGTDNRMSQGCSTCTAYSASRPIASHDDLVSWHAILMTAIRSGALEIEFGDLQWDDVIDCTLKCPVCGQRFHLTCETYHGKGGEWRVD